MGDQKRMAPQDTTTNLSLGNKDCERMIEARTESYSSSTLHLQLIDDALGPLCRTEDLDLLPDETDSV